MTRRDAIRLALAGAAAGSLPLPGRAAAATVEDIQKLEKLAVAAAVRAEQTTMVAFEAIANGGLLDERATSTMRVLSDHAHFHVEVLEQLYRTELGDRPPLSPSRNQIPGLGALHGQPGALRLAAGLERKAISAHLGAVRGTHNAQLLKAIAGIVGSDAQGLVLLRQLLSQAPVPSAFERGQSVHPALS